MHSSDQSAILTSNITQLIASYFTEYVKAHGALCQNLPVHWVAAVSGASIDRHSKETSSMCLIIRTIIIPKEKKKNQSFVLNKTTNQENNTIHTTTEICKGKKKSEMTLKKSQIFFSHFRFIIHSILTLKQLTQG